jgi:hypothetical protein
MMTDFGILKSLSRASSNAAANETSPLPATSPSFHLHLLPPICHSYLVCPPPRNLLPPPAPLATTSGDNSDNGGKTGEPQRPRRGATRSRKLVENSQTMKYVEASKWKGKGKALKMRKTGKRAAAKDVPIAGERYTTAQQHCTIKKVILYIPNKRVTLHTAANVVDIGDSSEP